MRCAYCHEHLGDAASLDCAGCGTVLHPDCASALSRCPTLGCADPVFALLRPPPPPFAGFSTRRRTLWIVCGMLLPALALLIDAGQHLNPIAWGIPDLDAAHGPTAWNYARYLGVLLAAVIGMVGLGLTLAGRLRPALPCVAVGFTLATLQGLAFLLLFPVTALLILIGEPLGLLGLVPLGTCAVFVDAARQLRRRLRAEADPDRTPTPAPERARRDPKRPLRAH